MKSKPSWIVKRDETPPPRVQYLREPKGALFPAGKMLISSPLEIQSVIARIPEGRLLPLDQLRDHLAQAHKADYTCPMTTGIFLRIVAEAAVEENNDVPYWRVVRADGRLIDKLPGGETAQARRLRAEGIACKPAGANKYRVEDLPALVWRP